MENAHRSLPTVTGLSPKEGMPGTTVTIRGEHLGTDPTDLVALVICGTDCLVSAQWKSSSKIIARIGQAKRGLGEIIIVTKSGGRGVSNVQFRVFIEQVGPLTESPIWVDESRTVPSRNIVRNVTELPETRDALGLKKDATTDQTTNYNELIKLFPDASGNLRMNNFNPAWYLFENHKKASFNELQKGIVNMKREMVKDRQTTNDTHRNNLYSLIDCVDALYNLHMSIESDCEQYGWPLTTNATQLLTSGRKTADKLFSEVLSRKDRADVTRNAMSVLTRFRFIFFLIDSIDGNMKSGDYASILNDYTRAKALFKDSDTALFKEVIAMLEVKMSKFKEMLKQKLIDTPSSYEEQSRLIKYLKILDPTSNPAWECITAYHCWLEKILWDYQYKYSKLAAGEELQGSVELVRFESVSHYILIFITELLLVLTDKLSSFWKLAQNYSDASDEKYLEQQDDINQMLTNTINVSSWLIWNALMPSALPEQISEQYKNEFVEWKGVDSMEQEAWLQMLLQAQGLVRRSVKLLLESQFSRSHVQPLIELCKTIRMKCIEILTFNAGKQVVALSSQETWNIDIGIKMPKTALPDLYEGELNEITSDLVQVLNSQAFPGEEDLLVKEKIRQKIVNWFILAICSYTDCCENLIRVKKRPNRLAMNSTHGTAIEDAVTTISELNSRKLLICICNLEYVLQHSLPTICKRFSESGVKYADLILECSKHRFLDYQKQLFEKYLELKRKPLDTLITNINYTRLPDEDDVSSFIKELIMGIVFIKAEIYLLLPHLTYQLVSTVIEHVVQSFLKRISSVLEQSVSDEMATQIVTDMTAIESTLQPYLSSEKRKSMGSFRSPLISRLDDALFQSSIKNFHATMRLAIEGLQTDTDGRRSDVDASDV